MIHEVTQNDTKSEALSCDFVSFRGSFFPLFFNLVALERAALNSLDRVSQVEPA
jgi:hypothetical protein